MEANNNISVGIDYKQVATIGKSYEALDSVWLRWQAKIIPNHFLLIILLIILGYNFIVQNHTHNLVKEFPYNKQGNLIKLFNHTVFSM